MISGLTHPKPETGFFGKYIFTKPTIFRKNPVSLREFYSGYISGHDISAVEG
jgi:hypothetical protein